MGKVLIIGGTKGIGKAIVSEIIEEHEVVCLSRNVSDFTHNNYKHIRI